MAKAQTISLTLTEPQYEALCSAIVLLTETFSADGPESVGMGPHVPRSLGIADDKLRAAWRRAVDGF